MAFPQCVFDHWEVMTGDPTLEGTASNLIVKEIRKRKNMNQVLPNFNDFNDKL